MKLFFSLLLFSSLSLGSLRAITADELALFLGICSWETRIAVPPTQVNIEIFEIENGSVGRSILKGKYASGCIPPETNIRIIGTRYGTPTRIQLWFEGQGSENDSEKTGSIPISAHLVLPKVIEPGDYILGGQLSNFDDLFSKKVENYESGLLLRVTKKG